MKVYKFLLIIVLQVVVTSCMFTEVSVYERQQFSSEVEDLLKKMTIEEKVGQMTQVNLNMILEGGYSNTDGSINEDQLREAVLKYKVGSILNAVPGAYPVEKWHEIITKIQDVAMESPNKIPVVYGIDAIHGANYTSDAILLPHNIALAATRNPSLAHKGADITAKQVRASGIRWNFDPCLDVGRHPLWGRFEETFGEDPTLASIYAKEVIKGYEEDGLKSPEAVASCMKHYLGYSLPRTGKDRTPSYIPEIELREIFLPPFEAAVKAGASSVMINSGEINGIPVHANEYLLNTVLRDELGFKGVTVSDWEDIIRLHTRHNVAETPKEAVKMGVMAGIDMSMVPHDYSFYDLLLELVNEGNVPVQRIDEAAGRILEMKYKLGLFENPYPEEEATKFFSDPSYNDIALQAARESLVLLKNQDNILPLKKDQKILLAGPAAQNVATLSGSWSYTWQGNDISKYPEEFKSIGQVMTEYAGNRVTVLGEKEWNGEKNYDVNALKSSAKDADVIVLCLGEDAYAESPGGIDDLTLPRKQLDLAKAAISTGKPVVLLLSEGRPRLITEVEPQIKGILLSMRPGTMGAHAITDVLYGDYNPNGKLPFTYQKYPNDLVLYDAKNTDLISEITPNDPQGGGYKPLFPFGHGLSYSTFTVDNLKLDKSTLGKDEKLKVSVDIKNNGPFNGEYAIDLFTRDLYASVTPSTKKLRKFKKVTLKNGEKKTVEFELDHNDLSFINAELKRVTEPGEFEVIINDNIKRFSYLEKERM